MQVVRLVGTERRSVEARRVNFRIEHRAGETGTTRYTEEYATDGRQSPCEGRCPEVGRALGGHAMALVGK